LDVPRAIPSVVVGKKNPLVVALKADETSEFSLTTYHPGPHPELLSRAVALKLKVEIRAARKRYFIMFSFVGVIFIEFITIT
jgi:hypothetical protein